MTTNYTLEQVREALAKVQSDASTILLDVLGTRTTNSTSMLGDLPAKKYGAVIRKCEKVLERQAKEAKREAEQAERDAQRERDTAEGKAVQAKLKAEALEALDAEGKLVTELCARINQQELAAANAYVKGVGTADSMKEELGKKLNDLRPRCKAAGMTFDEFKEKYVGDLYERAKIYEIMKVARGEITFDEIRLLERVKKQKQAAAKKASGKTQPSQTTTSKPDETTAETSKPAETSTAEKPRATGSADTEQSTEERKQYFETIEDKSDRLLKAWAEVALPSLDDMTHDDYKKAKVRYHQAAEKLDKKWVTELRAKAPVKRAA